MTTAIIIALSVLVLCAYVFDISAARTRIPSVILLLSLGWAASQAVTYFGLNIPEIASLLPMLGTIGLILIVLEGSMDLELKKENLTTIYKSMGSALIPFVVVAIAFASFLHFQFGHGYQISLANVIPLCVISSAIAIPTARHLQRRDREFIVFESSLSDIMGVICFNLVAVETAVSFGSIWMFLLQFVLMLVISFLCTALLSVLLGKINHPVKFTPIIFSLILVYVVSKVYHLPGLMFILIFGAFLSNLDQVAKVQWMQWLKPAALESEVKKFKEIVHEGTFLVRVLFFLLFGYSLQTVEIIDQDSLPWALGVVGIILVVRAIQLKVMRLPLVPLLFIAPRGLITILLYLSLPASLALPQVNKSLIVQVILLTAFIMMLGMIFGKGGKKNIKDILIIPKEELENERNPD